MSVISKSLAEEIAERLVLPLEKKKEDLINQRQDVVFQYFKKQVPLNILKLYSKDKSFFQKFSSGVFIKNREHIGYFNFPGIPAKNSDSKSIDCDETCKLIEGINVRIFDTNKEITESKCTIFNSLMGLKTYSKIRELMPDAGKFLPDTKQGMA